MLLSGEVQKQTLASNHVELSSRMRQTNNGHAHGESMGSGRRVRRAEIKRFIW